MTATDQPADAHFIGGGIAGRADADNDKILFNHLFSGFAPSDQWPSEVRQDNDAPPSAALSG